MPRCETEPILDFQTIASLPEHITSLTWARSSWEDNTLSFLCSPLQA